MMNKVSVFSLFALLFSLVVTNVSAYSPADFAKAEAYSSVKISPDGRHLAVAFIQNGRRQLMMLNVESFSVVGHVNFGQGSEPGQFYWVNNQRLVLQLLQFKHAQEESVNYGELYAVDYDGRNGELIYGYRAGEKTTGSRIKKKKAVRGWAEIIDLLPDDPKYILISSTPMTTGGEKHPTVHKLNVNNGKMSKRLARYPVPYAHFVTDKKHKIALAIGTDQSDKKQVYRFEPEERIWTQLAHEAFGGAFTPFALNPSGDSLYVLDNYKQDRIGLFKLNLTSSKMTHIYTDENVDITDAVLTSDNNSVYALRVDPDFPNYLMLNKKLPEAKIFKNLLNTFPGQKVNITSHDKEGNLWVVFTRTDTSAGDFYLYNKKKNGLTHLFTNLEHLDPNAMARTEPISFTASDGQVISGYMTYPKGMKAGDEIPLVTLVHGGPHGIRDYWNYNPEVQLLAAQGYGVLQVNFRGSGGYGFAFEASGYQEWGARMQLDIIEGTQWALSADNIDDNKVCIMGASFGGFSAVQSATLAPDLFKCVVANAGVYDLKLMFEHGDITDTLWGDSYLSTALGSSAEQYQQQSPISNLASLKAPVLIAHGERDRRVPFIQAQRLKQAMDKLNKPYVWFVKEGETHGFYGEKNRGEYYQKLTDFMAEYLK